MAQMTKKELKELRKLEKLQQQTLSQKQNTTKWIAIAIAAGLFLTLFIGAVIIGKNRNNPSNTALTATFANDGHVRMVGTDDTNSATGGAEQSEEVVTMVEYADIQCPACKQYHPIVKTLLELYPGELRLVFKHFPLTSLHPNAVISATAAEAAGRQGRFFEMTDLLYERQAEWSGLPNPAEKFAEYAKQLALDVNKFNADLKDKEIAAIIETQRNEGIKNGVNATPAFFVEGNKIDNPADIEGFQKIIDEALKAKGGSAPQQNPQPTVGNGLPLSE